MLMDAACGSCVWSGLWPRLNAPTLDEANKNEDDGHHQKYVDKAAHRIGRHESKQPQDDQN